MKSFVLVMKRMSLAEGLIKIMSSDNETEAFYESDYANAEFTIKNKSAQAALIEITENYECDTDYCLGLCSYLKKATPNCRLLLMCPENNTYAVKKAELAKKDGLIDSYIFYNVSLNYISKTLNEL